MKIDGTKVVDAKRSLTFLITAKDIKAASKGGRKNPNACAAAQALMRKYGKVGVSEVRVQLGRTYVKHGKVWKRYQTTGPLYREVITFDRYGDFEPGEYRIIPPTPSAQLGARSGTSTNQNSKSGKLRQKYHFMANVRRLEGMSRRG